MAATSDVDGYGIPIIADPVSSSERKRQAIIETAIAEFLREGYSATSMDVIARRAGVSKPTVYKHFGNKERLFLAVIGGVLTSAYSGLDPQSAKISQAPDVRAALNEFLIGWSRRVLSEDIMALRRLVIGEVSRFPQLGQLWYDITTGMMDACLAEAFTELTEQGVLDVPDTEPAVRQLVGLTLGGPQLLQTFLPQRTLDDSDLEQTISGGVEVFLSHYSHGRPKR